MIPKKKALGVITSIENKVLKSSFEELKLNVRKIILREIYKEVGKKQKIIGFFVDYGEEYEDGLTAEQFASNLARIYANKDFIGLTGMRSYYKEKGVLSLLRGVWVGGE